ncbi:NAD-dependent epimerase/dehydratase family protein [Leptospira sp. 96542]|nr:NAD-dependent epimerase/dehydratase family protein [Leptospira sp. 96542]
MKILLLGGTGLIGKQVLLSLVFYPQIEKVFVWARNSKPNTNQNVPIEIHSVTWEGFQSGKTFVPDDVDAVFCCLGTTINKAGTRERFREIDYDYPLLAARQAKEKGIKRFFVVTAMGSHSESIIFYNRVKGELERDLILLKLPFLGIFRPSLLLGNREETRFGEKVGEFVSGFIPFGIFGLDKMRPIPAELVAKSMIESLLNDSNKPSESPVVKIYENDTMWKTSKA